MLVKFLHNSRLHRFTFETERGNDEMTALYSRTRWHTPLAASHSRLPSPLALFPNPNHQNNLDRVQQTERLVFFVKSTIIVYFIKRLSTCSKPLKRE
ncbi:hypothetical protein ACS0TY_018545 [Phlomoides rotata]